MNYCITFCISFVVIKNTNLYKSKKNRMTVQGNNHFLMFYDKVFESLKNQKPIFDKDNTAAQI